MQLVFELSPRLQRVIALALAAVPIVVLGTALSTFVGDQIDRHRQAAVLTHKIARERAILAVAPEWHEQLQELQSSPDWQGLLVAPAETGNTALVTLIRSNGGRVELNSTHRMPTSGAVEIDEYVRFSGTMAQLANVLQSLRGRQPLFVVRAVSVESSDDGGQPKNSKPNFLHIRLTVAEFERPS